MITLDRTRLIDLPHIKYFKRMNLIKYILFHIPNDSGNINCYEISSAVSILSSGGSLKKKISPRTKSGTIANILIFVALIYD